MSDEFYEEIIEDLVDSILKNIDVQCLTEAHTLIRWMHTTISTAMNFCLREKISIKGSELITTFITTDLISDIIYSTAGNRNARFRFSSDDIKTIYDETIRLSATMRDLDNNIFKTIMEEQNGTTKKKNSGKKSDKPNKRNKGKEK